MKTKIKISLFVAASFIYAANGAKAQTCCVSQVTYAPTSSSNYLPKWNATAGCISNSPFYDNSGNIRWNK